VIDAFSGLTLHHVGFVVPDITAAMAGFANSLAAAWDGRIYDDPQQKVKVAFLVTHPAQAQIELVEPAADESPVLRFLREKGGGLHHVCYEVEDLETNMAAMRSRGSVIAKRPKPAVAFNGRRIAWMLTPEKLLIELLERSNPKESCHG
jgi:methylmalonyl-CoA/ethylmalonyl-CoA epimerase